MHRTTEDTEGRRKTRMEDGGWKMEDGEEAAGRTTILYPPFSILVLLVLPP
jgi:hypothetical protein